MARKRRVPLSGLVRGVGLALAALGCAAATPRTFTVTLWANDDSIERLPEVVGWSDHPCGAVAEVRLTTMPLYREAEGPLGTELIVETDAAGRELARWSVPVDYEVLAVRGPEILLRHHRQRLWIGTNGSLRAAPRGGRERRPGARSCPAGSALADSAYRQCATFADQQDGRRRLIEYEGSCT